MKPLSPAIARSTVLITARRLAAFTLLLGLSSAATAAGQFFCCNDANGKQVCGDILPHECIGRAYRELGSSGLTLRHVEAPQTPEQRAQRAADEEKRKIEEDKRKEQQRKDQALLNTYGNEQDISLMRERAEADIHKSIKTSEIKIVEIRTLRKKFENEAEFYKKKTIPPDIQKGLRNADYEIKAQESIIESKKQELEVIKKKYDEDLRRYMELSRRAPAR
jgi:hypothetical protein